MRSALLQPASIAHYVTLLAAAIFLVVVGRGQWFFFDEWDFLRLTQSDYFQDHVGHWSTLPMLLYTAMVWIFGLGSYWPFLALTIVIHLVLASLLWRVMIRSGVQRWVAVGMGTVFAVYGGGGENIFWAFQTAFIGAVVLALCAALIIDRMTPDAWGDRRRYVVVAILMIASVMTAGTALPVLGAAALLGLRRVGVKRTVLLFLPVAAVYLVWYAYDFLVYGPSGAYRANTLDQLLVGVPEYAGSMLTGSLTAVALVPLGVILGVVLLVYLCARGRTLWRASPLVLALAAAGGAFALLTAYQRFNLGMETATSSRYLYMAFAMMVPALGSLISWAARRPWWLSAVVTAALLALAVANAASLAETARAQSQTEKAVQGLVYATVAVVAADTTDTIPDCAIGAAPLAPTLTVHDIREYLAAGKLPIGDYSPADLATAQANLAEPCPDERPRG